MSKLFSIERKTLSATAILSLFLASACPSVELAAPPQGIRGLTIRQDRHSKSSGRAGKAFELSGASHAKHPEGRSAVIDACPVFPLRRLLPGGANKDAVTESRDGVFGESSRSMEGEPLQRIDLRVVEHPVPRWQPERRPTALVFSFALDALGCIRKGLQPL